MSACPVSLDIDRHLAEIDDADRFDNMVETIKGEYSAKEAAEIIGEHFADTGGDSLIALLGYVSTGQYKDREEYAIRLHAALDDILTKAAEEEAKNRLERADDYDGDE